MALSLVELGSGLHFLSVNLTPYDHGHGPPLRNVTMRKEGKGPFKCYVTHWGYQILLEKSITKMYGPTLLALRGGEWGSHFPGNSVTKCSLEIPLRTKVGSVIRLVTVH